MKASRNANVLCRMSLATMIFAAGLAMAGCSDTGTPAPPSAQVAASPVVAVHAKGKEKVRPQIQSRRDLHRQAAQTSKDSQ